MNRNNVVKELRERDIILVSQIKNLFIPSCVAVKIKGVQVYLLDEKVKFTGKVYKYSRSAYFLDYDY